MSNFEQLPEFIPAGGPVKFPETAEAEARRAGEYFLLHPVATHQDTYGEEDRSLPDWPMGVPEKLEQ